MSHMLDASEICGAARYLYEQLELETGCGRESAQGQRLRLADAGPRLQETKVETVLVQYSYLQFNTVDARSPKFQSQVVGFRMSRLSDTSDI